MNKIFLLSLISAICISGNVIAQNENQDGILQVQEIYGEEGNQTMQAPATSNSSSNQTSTSETTNNTPSSNNADTDGQLMIEETISAEGTVENE